MVAAKGLAGSTRSAAEAAAASVVEEEEVIERLFHHRSWAWAMEVPRTASYPAALAVLLFRL